VKELIKEQIAQTETPASVELEFFEEELKTNS